MRARDGPHQRSFGISSEGEDEDDTSSISNVKVAIVCVVGFIVIAIVTITVKRSSRHNLRMLESMTSTVTGSSVTGTDLSSVSSGSDARSGVAKNPALESTTSGSNTASIVVVDRKAMPLDEKQSTSTFDDGTNSEHKRYAPVLAPL